MRVIQLAWNVAAEAICRLGISHSDDLSGYRFLARLSAAASASPSEYMPLLNAWSREGSDESRFAVYHYLCDSPVAGPQARLWSRQQ